MTPFKPGQQCGSSTARSAVGIWSRAARGSCARLGDDRYLVRFPDGDLVERFVDPKAQADPYAYVRTPNNNEAA
jgi:hypothetical protein